MKVMLFRCAPCAVSLCLLLVCFALCAVSGRAQNMHYSQFRSGLAPAGCNARPTADECRQSIRLIWDWMWANPEDTMTGAYWDLQLYHYLLSGRDTAGRREHLEKSIFYNIWYCELAEVKQKHSGYWNAAVCYSLVGDCGNALKYLRLSKTSPGAKNRYQHRDTARIIKKMCGKKHSG